LPIAIGAGYRLKFSLIRKRNLSGVLLARCN